MALSYISPLLAEGVWYLLTSRDPCVILNLVMISLPNLYSSLDERLSTLYLGGAFLT